MRTHCSVALLTFSSFVLSQMALAQKSTSKAKAAPITEPATVKSEETPSTESTAIIPNKDIDSSAYARSIKTAGVALRYGFIIGAFTAPGLDVFMHHGSDWEFGGLYETGSKDFKSELASTGTPFVELAKAEIAATIIAAYGRYYVGDSFYLVGMGGYRTIDLNIDVRSTISNDAISATINVKNTFVGLNIGNVWAWSNGFFVGADWIGLMFPLTNTVETSVKVTGTETSDIAAFRATSEDSGRTLGSSIIGQVLVGSIGFSF